MQCFFGEESMFTFVVTCYNQEQVVTQALDSVRYQIEKYGGGQEFQLIVTDDCSRDESRDVIDRWIKKNGLLFKTTEKLFRKENAGICRNYVEALRRVEGERFMVLNGDDVLAPYNLFELTGLLEKYDLICTAFIRFSGKGQMVGSYHTYLEVALQNFIRGKTLRRAIRLGCPIMGTAIYRKELLTESVFDFILKFRTVNDRACFQKILDENKDIRVHYVNRPIILYRITDGSISNFNSPARLLHNREVAQLCRVEREKEKSAFFRLMLLLQEKSAAVRSSSHYCIRLLRFFSPYFAIMLWLFMVHYSEIKRLEHELIDLYWKECEGYYKKLDENTLF